MSRFQHGFSGNGGFKQVTFITLGEQNATQKRSGTDGRRTLRHRWSVEVIPTSHQHRTYTSTRKSTQSQRAPLHAYQRISVSAYQRNTMTTTDTIVSK
ncbi:hypothetical protein PC123_g22656 [Phytophthora cactorum]|nr:hypothetical protein PC123_g22656 [Phytophthora cactorum]